MVFTRTGRKSHASDEDARVNPGSLPGGPVPTVHNRVLELRQVIDEAVKEVSPRKPGAGIFDRLDATLPVDRRGSWEGLMSPAKPAEQMYEGDGTLDHGYQLPPPDEPVSRVFSTPRRKSVDPRKRVMKKYADAVRNFEWPFARDKDTTATSVGDASFRTADPDSTTANVPKAAASQAAADAPASSAATTETTPGAIGATTPSQQSRTQTPSERAAAVSPPLSKPASIPLPVSDDELPRVGSTGREDPSASVKVQPTVKFGAPTTSAGTKRTWQEVQEGDVVSIGDFIPVKTSSPKSNAPVQVPPITGPQAFPAWFSHYNSADNSVRFESWSEPGLTNAQGKPEQKNDAGTTPQTAEIASRPPSRASQASSMPSLAATSETAVSSSARSSRGHAGQRTAAAGSAKPQVVNAYDEKGSDNALAYLCDVFPDNDIAINRQWLMYVREMRARGARMNPNTIADFADYVVQRCCAQVPESSGSAPA